VHQWLDSMLGSRGAKPLVYAAATDYARGISPLLLSRSRECVDWTRDASHIYAQPAPASGTPHHRAISMCGALAMLVSISALLGPALVTVEDRSDSSSQRRPVCAWLSLYRSRERLYTLRSGIHRAGLGHRGTITARKHNTVCKPPCAGMERMSLCMQYAACSCPASTTSAMSSSRVLTHRLAICSRSELLHRGNT
jgi:hypothetical protein